MALDPRSRRLISSAYVLAKRRGERKHRADIEDLADRFEACNEATLEEIRNLRSELVHAHMVADAMAERAEHGWLH